MSVIKLDTVSIETKTFVDIQCEFMYIFSDAVSQIFIFYPYICIAFFWKIRGPKYIIKKWAYYLHTIQQKFSRPDTFLVNIVYHRAVSSDP